MVLGVCVVAALVMQCQTAQAQKVEPSNEAKWYFAPGAGVMHVEGDEEVEPGFIISTRLGYDYNQRWTFEGLFYIAPYLKEKMRYRMYPNDTTGTYQWLSMVDEKPGERFGSTYGAGLAVDALFHFTRWERLDPYLTIGGAMAWYGHEINGERFDPAIRIGGGVMWHFNDEWAVRADYRGYLAGLNNIEANSMLDAGVVWTWGARVPVDLKAVGGPLDSDRDGLPDEEEGKRGTDRLNPDTDSDGLKDGEEVYTYSTNPLNADTDNDLLKDGEEVKKYETEPLVADTDEGGVIDGHEVLEDNTDPRKSHGNDDVILFELHVQFEYDKAVILPAYNKQLDVIGKVLSRHPKATAKVEGHCDRFNTKNHISDPRHNKKLSEQRAQAIVDYLVKNFPIKKDRLAAKGFGFERPKDPKKVDLVNGNPENRRDEVYIKGVDKTKAQLETEGYSIPAVDVVPPTPDTM